MRILILGGNGMLGHQVCRELHADHNCFTTFRQPDSVFQEQWFFKEWQPDRLIGNVDALDMPGVVSVMEMVRPDVVVNCIGIVKQRGESADAITSIRVNSLFPHLLAVECANLGARLIHYSTDCVFSGRRGDYMENDVPDPVDLYGRSKLLGEVSGSGCLTIRTSIVGWELGTTQGLLEWFASQRYGHISGYKYAIYTGLSTKVAAALTRQIVEEHKALEGIYHVASSPISKYELLTLLRDRLGWQRMRIDANDTFRCDRSLSGERFAAEIDWQAPSWNEMIDGLADEFPDYEAFRKERRNESKTLG